MIRRNLVVDAGAVNGSQGRPADVGIVKNSQEKRKDGLPDCVLVALPRGQCALPSFNNRRWVPHPCEACRNRRRRPGDPPPGDCKDCVVPMAEDGTDLFALIPVTPTSNMRFHGVFFLSSSSGVLLLNENLTDRANACDQSSNPEVRGLFLAWCLGLGGGTCV